MADQFKGRTKESGELASMLAVFAGADYATDATVQIHLGALTGLSVPEKVRDLSGTIYEVFQCLVEDCVPVMDADSICYMGCPMCKQWYATMAKNPFPMISLTATL